MWTWRAGEGWRGREWRGIGDRGGATEASRGSTSEGRGLAQHRLPGDDSPSPPPMGASSRCPEECRVWIKQVRGMYMLQAPLRVTHCVTLGKSLTVPGQGRPAGDAQGSSALH